ncbi:hypothetical protein B0H34DRAFT_373063 [Crassisporium funariophilum]|nr:hypothetical protein B0H34DRAFT_373063 [Crassisporium funariophilum]
MRSISTNSIKSLVLPILVTSEEALEERKKILTHYLWGLSVNKIKEAVMTDNVRVISVTKIFSKGLSASNLRRYADNMYIAATRDQTASQPHYRTSYITEHSADECPTAIFHRRMVCPSVSSRISVEATSLSHRDLHIIIIMYDEGTLCSPAAYLCLDQAPTTRLTLHLWKSRRQGRHFHYKTSPIHREMRCKP